MNPRLIATEGPLKGSIFPIPEGALSIGRDSARQLQLRDSAVSREHCVITRVGDRVTLADSGSHNGTYVNGRNVPEQALRDGDQIRIGASCFIFMMSEPWDEPSSPPSHTVELHQVDSVYLSSAAENGYALDQRAAHDMRMLIRLSTLLHSFRALHDSHNSKARETLSRHLMSLLLDVLPGASGAVLGSSPDPGAPYEVLAASADLPPVDAALFQRSAAQGVAVLAGTAITAPILIRDEVEAVLYFAAKPGKEFDEGHLQLITAVAGMAAVAWENATMLEWLTHENDQLQEALGIEHGMVGESSKLQELQKQIQRVAPSNSTVLILGESGTGKELIARAIHRNSPRTGPFVAINCAALTDTLLESELFGYEKGAFTGAMAQRKGKLESAEGGTVFLDEIGELSPLLQAKLLRVLQERELQRVGGTKNIKLDIRLIAATNRDLGEDVKRGAFRQDLYYRLNVVSLRATPLRQRPEDILPLAEHFAKKFAQQCGRKIAGISPKARTYLQSYSWPGNVRELENAIERAVVLGSDETILPEDLPENIREERPAEVKATLYEEAVEAAKKQVVLRAFEQAGYEHEQAAKLLGLHPNYLHRLIRNMDMKAALKSAARGR